MFPSLVLLVSGAAFLYFAFQKTFLAGRDVAAETRLNVACLAAGVILFIAVATTYLGGAATQTTIVSVSWLLGLTSTVLSGIFLLSRWLDKPARA